MPQNSPKHYKPLADNLCETRQSWQGLSAVGEMLTILAHLVWKRREHESILN